MILVKVVLNGLYPRGPLRLMYRLYRHIFPAVRAEVERWRERAGQIPDPELRKQALDSIENKRFHCEGGSVYAAAHLAWKEPLIRLIVAYQTISDYLDNLCDRSTSLGANNFARLHQAMLDAVSGRFSSVDYYEFNREKDDGGYLRALVAACHAEIEHLPNYALVRDDVYELASLYCNLQVHKHVVQEEREGRLLNWWQEHRGKAPDLKWNEFAAATGSTLGVFHLFQIASYPEVSASRIAFIKKAYFPWVCSLHILLDYLIDLEEDEIGGDLNFIAYYQNEREIYERIHYIVGEAKKNIQALPDRKFHNMIVDGLLGLYLSDGKVQRQPMVRRVARWILRSSSLPTRFFFLNSRGYRGGKAVLQAPPSGK
ncbi:tetraprenyl-beta-curcumene synthase family protein [Aneurinibacillus thermoaerophilus]|uniref:Tetraprenyl-beta-curcumene synthase n=2 Tax=Aneurinibacillus thermoaerophilus TaxID=143495 RepID=A0A1G8AUW4_ANETH|nr:tetraprenyl-beta-curcumene synthase family protein [Aneurinibacillus thermoaerophilus]MED0675220.1 tetraprenyl-beta-curcumene synthase family protein [Aneurinibacillus thermoaerophilus]MED0680084.1 tetraprenyl-beta-curcumene synthase family protein [Aneurinibacillus thermoaerophilus]MED0738158.1 tetraprenyl-beta-curcumene synthase family protein [Aneurinibacillus thermoaerophilus]MED0758224.1 tetraprenyl-beta-curcumene synthase family protein [Aneurinibacillus thermoaerophilus]MED0761378.1 